SVISQNNILFEHYSIDEGLSQSTINYIFQDSEGLIWLATYDGLNKFDGYTFTIFRNDPDNKNTVSQNYLICIEEDAHGNIWIGTFNKGVDIYNKSKNEFINFQYNKNNPNSISNNQIKRIFRDSKDNMWIATNENGLNKFVEYNKRFIRFLHDKNNPNSIPFPEVFSICEDSSGNILVGMSGAVYSEIDPLTNIVVNKQYTSYNIEGKSQNTGNIVFIDSKNKLWIGTEGYGLFRQMDNPNEFRRYSDENENEITNNIITSFLEDNKSNIWIGTNGGGVNIYNRKEDKFYYYKYDANSSKSLSSNAIYSIVQDQGGSVWVGTFGAGLNIYNQYKLKFTHYNHNPLDPNSLSYKSVMDIFQDKKDNIWIATDGGGFDLFRKDENLFVHHKHDPNDPRSNPSGVIICIYEDKQENFWLGTYARGLLLYDRNNGRYTQFLPNVNNPESIGHLNVWAITEDSYNNLWVGLMGGSLDLYDRESKTFKHYVYDVNDPNKLSNPNIKTLFEDSRKYFWVGTEGGGLHKYLREKDCFKRYMFDETNKSSLSNNDVRRIFEDSKNNLWIGTAGGLNLFNYETENFIIYTEKDGLPSNVVNDILEDDNGYLWMSTNNGITKFDPVNKEFRNYGVGDGLQGREYNYTSSLKSKEGDMYFGGINGFNVFNPNHIKDNPYKPPVILTDFKIFNESYQTISRKVKDSLISESISTVKEIKLNYKQNVISFEFAALDFASPEKNKYKYMLVGFDQDWIETDASKRFASYTNLEGGEYYFKVIASNNDGVWNENGVNVKIIVNPPYWKTWWFRISLSLIVILIVIFGIRYRIKALKEEKLLLEQKIHDAIAEIEDKKQELEEQNKQLLLKKEEDEIRNWASKGVAMFSDILRQNNDSIDKMAKAVIHELVKYTNINIGGFWIKNKDNEGNTILELKGISGFSDGKFEKRMVYEREELVGACAFDRKTMYITEIPDNYIKIESGLGFVKAKCLLLLPLIYNEHLYGVIELASTRSLPQYTIQFIEELSEKIASSINTIQINERTSLLLQQTELQSNELQSSEEELRQNLEEMQATQEQTAKREEFLLQEIENLKVALKGSKKSHSSQIIQKQENISAIKPSARKRKK
ncbi:MAG: GAF domain-containing protein, partial [Bacteroidales bacterium]|nr:GAF domain-containing protein [Bacteroidales bacterium]